jgi:hypothetical protein
LTGHDPTPETAPPEGNAAPATARLNNMASWRGGLRLSSGLARLAVKRR